MEEVNIVETFQLLLRRLWILILASVFCAAVGFGYCKLILIPKYTANAKVVITTGGILSNENIEDPTKITQQDVATSFAMLETYAITLDMLDMYYIVADEIEGQVAEKYSAAKLKNITSYKYSESSLVLSVIVTCTNQKDAVVIANNVAKQAPKYLQQFFPTTSALVVEYSENAGKSYPNAFLTTLVAGMVGFAVAAVIIYIIAVTDKTIKSEERLTSLGLSVIGVVPDFTVVEKGGYYHHD